MYKFFMRSVYGSIIMFLLFAFGWYYFHSIALLVGAVIALILVLNDAIWGEDPFLNGKRNISEVISGNRKDSEDSSL